MNLRSSRLTLVLAALATAAVAAPGLSLAQGAPAPVGAASSTPAASTQRAGGPSWSSLNAQQRTVLAPLERDWGSIDAPRKAKWIEVAGRFSSLSATDQQRVHERMAEWARMTPTERGRARLSFQESKQLSPEQKQARWEAYQALPDEERKALAVRSKPAEDPPKGVAPAAMGAASASRPILPARASGPQAQAKPVSPTVVQAKPGATTTLMTTPVEPPVHHRPGQPKIAAQVGQVNPSTLLPQSGPQSAAPAASTRHP